MTLGSVSVETIQETNKILLFADINGRNSLLVCSGLFVVINSTWLKLPAPEQTQEEVGYGLYIDALKST